MRKFLEFKHWQLFLLIVICGSWKSPSPLEEIIHFISIITFTGWIYSLGVYGHQLILNLGLSSMKIKTFRFNVLLVGITLVSSLIWSHYITETNSVQVKDIPLIFFWIYFSYALLQPICFVCKILAKIERKSEVIFSDYLSYLLLMFFFPIGIWIIQPKINRLFSKPLADS